MTNANILPCASKINSNGNPAHRPCLLVSWSLELTTEEHPFVLANGFRLQSCNKLPLSVRGMQR